MSVVRSYSELLEFDTLEQRFDYLNLEGLVGGRTFGHERWINQGFYSSYEWKDVRQTVILRDHGCDLGVPGYDIYDRIYIHHMNPMTADQLRSGDPAILDPEYLISVTHRTHNAIHYGDKEQLPRPLIERKPGDHILW